MKALLTDPVVLICGGIILIGLFALFWAIGKLRKPKGAPEKAWPADAISMAFPAGRGLDAPAAPSPAPAMPMPTITPSTAINKEVVDRLESMTLRLTEMQSVLMRQPPSGTGEAAPAGVGQGFSPETIDKLLKIIGNVIQQVDILQKNVNPGKETKV